jgi:hypothetical protein
VLVVIRDVNHVENPEKKFMGFGKSGLERHRTRHCGYPHQRNKRGVKTYFTGYQA